MPRRLAALLLDLLLLQLLLLGGSGECITRDHAPLAAVGAVVDPHAAHAAHAGAGSHDTVAGHEHGTPADDGATPAPDGGAHCMMAASCASTSLAAHVPALHGMPPAHAAAIAPRIAVPASPAFSPEPPPPRA